MISDVLADAVDQIHQWLRTYEGHPYPDLAEELTDLLARMDKLRVQMDATPPVARG
jgi:hypothetical protein